MTKTNNKTLKLVIAVAILLVTLVTLGCLLAGAVTPVVAVSAMLMPVWIVSRPVPVVHHLVTQTSSLPSLSLPREKDRPAACAAGRSFSFPVIRC